MEAIKATGQLFIGVCGVIFFVISIIVIVITSGMLLDKK